MTPPRRLNPLVQRQCVPCTAATPRLLPDQAGRLLAQVPGWLQDSGMITRRLRFADFAEAMAFVNRVAALAEAEGHHPDMHISWSRVRLDLTTHVIRGLSENDFILAAKINELLDAEE